MRFNFNLSFPFWLFLICLILIVVILVLSFCFPCVLHAISDMSFCPGCGLQLNAVCPVCFESCIGDFCSDCGSPALLP